MTKSTVPLERARKRSIVVGIGDRLLKDDRVGIEVVEALQAKGAAVDTAILQSAGFELLETIIDHDEAVIVYACQMGLAPGTIVENTPEEMFDHDHTVGFHAITLGATLQTGQILFPGKMPKKIKLIMIQVEDISTFSTRCTPVVSHAIQDVVARIHPRGPSG